jgi:diguanylate cyclase (GGDEF)-like protein
MTRNTAIILLLASLLFFSCGDHRGPPPEAENGVLEIRDWDLNTHGPIPLSGNWEFRWNELADPVSGVTTPTAPTVFYKRMPGTWKGTDGTGKPLSSSGCATYRLKVLLENERSDLALRFITVSTAARLYVNGEKVYTAGSVGKDAKTSIPAYNPRVIPLNGSYRTLDLVMQVSNFHYRSGGPWRSIILGRTEDLQRQKRFLDFMTIGFFGAIFAIFLYHATLYLMRRSDMQFLYYSLFCLCISLRTLSTGEYLLSRILPDTAFSLLIRTEYLSYYLAVPLFLLFVNSLYRQEFHLPVLRIAITACLAFSLFVLVAPVRIFTHTVFAFHCITIILIPYVMGVLIHATINRRMGAPIMLFGGFILSLTAINDILYSFFIIHTGNYINIGLFSLVFTQAILLSIRFTSSFTAIEALSHHLARLNDSLEQQVRDRTSDLQEAYETIKSISVRDPLTGCYNRRYLEDHLPGEIERAYRYSMPLSIILCDLDHFKNINDKFGHRTGDLALVSFTGVVDTVIRKQVDWLCRYGGEEFIIVIPKTPIDGATLVAERLRARLAENSIPGDEGPVRFTCSFGVTGIIPSEHTKKVGMMEILDTADRLMYAAKKRGRDRVESAIISPDPDN